MPIRFYYTGKAKETSSHPQSSFMFHFHLLTLKIQNMFTGFLVLLGA